MNRGTISGILVALLWTSMLTLASKTQLTRSASSLDSSWYKTELHHHSEFSDGYYDLGVVTQHAKDLGYNAFFLTDHDWGRPPRPDKLFEDSIEGRLLYMASHDSADVAWLEEPVHELVTAPVHEGVYSLHLRSNSSVSSCQRYAGWHGPILCNGSVVLNFSLYPATLSNPEFAGAYVELVFGLKAGWETFGADYNYLCEGGVTWANGTTTIPHHVILRFGILGSEGNVTRADETIRGFNLSVTLGAWNTFSINVTDYMLRSLPIMLAPDCAIDNYSLDCVTDHSEVSDVYFDDVALCTAELPKSIGELFAYRNEELASFDTDTFRVFPSVEFSEFHHFNHFVYNFTTSEGFYNTTQIASSNSEVVNFVHSQGYPIQINHPCDPDGLDVVENNAYGADLIEARSQEEIIIWDQLLSKGASILGVWSTDSHGFILQGDKSTMVYSPELTLEKLLENMFEGRMFLMVNNFTGTMIFNIKPSTEPYPARYVNYIAEGDEATLYLKATDLTNGWKVCWVRNGIYFLNETITRTIYAVSKTFSMPDEANYWRVEIRDASDNIIAMSEPVMFKKVSNMPSGMYAHVNHFTTPTGANYTNNILKAVTSLSYFPPELHLTVEGLGLSTTEIRVGGLYMPLKVFIGMVEPPVSNTKEDFDSALYNTWYYEAATGMLYIKAQHSVLSAESIVIQFASAGVDVTLTNLVCHKTVVGEGYVLFVMVTVENQGDVTETFNVTAYYNETALLIEEWPDGANSQTYWSMGDVNRDGYIDNWDLYRISHAFNKRRGDPGWDPDVDLNSDGVVNIIDISTCAQNYNKNRDIWTALGLPKLVENQRAVTVPAGNSTTITFRWNTTGVAESNYNISAYAWPLLGETDTADNTFIDSVIYVGIPGDINGDGTVDIYDAIMLAGTFNSKLYDSIWNANADINSDANVDIYDAIILANNYGETS